LAATVRCTRAPETLELDRIVHSRQATVVHPVIKFVDSPKDRSLLTAVCSHLRHEWQAVEHATAIERREDLLKKTYLDSLPWQELERPVVRPESQVSSEPEFRAARRRFTRQIRSVGPALRLKMVSAKRNEAADQNERRPDGQADADDGAQHPHET